MIAGKIYVVGGRGRGYEPLESVERYDPDADKWEFVARMVRPVEKIASATVGNKLYILGGFAPFFRFLAPQALFYGFMCPH